MPLISPRSVPWTCHLCSGSVAAHHDVAKDGEKVLYSLYEVGRDQSATTFASSLGEISADPQSMRSVCSNCSNCSTSRTNIADIGKNQRAIKALSLSCGSQDDASAVAHADRLR